MHDRPLQDRIPRCGVVKCSRTDRDLLPARHNLPLIDQNALLDLHPLDGPGNVIATSFFTDEFATAVAALGDSLNRANTTARKIMIYIPSQVSPRGLCIASATGFHPHPVARIEPPDAGAGVYPHFIDQYTKLRLWELDALGAKINAILAALRAAGLVASGD